MPFDTGFSRKSEIIMGVAYASMGIIGGLLLYIFIFILNLFAIYNELLTIIIRSFSDN